MFTSGSGPGILYGLPKIHKPNFDTNFQFRLIFAAYNTPSFNLAKFLVPILNPFTCNEFATANSHSFANDITSVEDASQFFMTSFDVDFFLQTFVLRGPSTFFNGKKKIYLLLGYPSNIIGYPSKY